MQVKQLSAVNGTTRPVLPPLARLDVEQARWFLMELDGRVDGIGLSRAMYLLGMAQGHLESLLDVLDATVAVTP